MQGQCLCGEIGFELSGEIPRLYQCHCSLCRKVSGSSSNAALIVARAQLDWTRGEERLREFALPSGFKSHFCAQCGSPLPNLTAQDSAWWVPVGLLDDSDALQLAAHVCVASRAGWDVIADSVRHFDDMPDAETMAQVLRPQSTE
jgi:hypothetical protein